MKDKPLGRCGPACIRRILEENERKIHETGMHRVRLLSNIRKDRLARRFIGIPVPIAAAVSAYPGLRLLRELGAQSGLDSTAFRALGVPFRILPDNSIRIGGRVFRETSGADETLDWV